MKGNLESHGWSTVLLNGDDKVVICEGLLHNLGFKRAVGAGYYHNGVLSFTEEYPNPLRAGTSVQHKTA
jgi:hypothetical protein